MPAMVEMRHLGGIDLTNCKCLEQGLVILLREGISTSTHCPPRRGFEAIMFILSRLQIDTNIFRSFSSSSAIDPGAGAPSRVSPSNSYQFSTKASGVITPIGT